MAYSRCLRGKIVYGRFGCGYGMGIGRMSEVLRVVRAFAAPHFYTVDRSLEGYAFNSFLMY